MSSNAEWKLATPPDASAHVDEDVLTLRTPLVRVHRDEEGSWFFDGPGTSPRPSQTTLLGAVVGAWPHVAALTSLDNGGSVIWSWYRHGWTSEFACRCGQCARPVPSDIDRRSWPEELRPNHIVSVEQTALYGQIALADIISYPDGIALLGPGDHRRTTELLTPVAIANVIRRWPHTMLAMRSLRKGYGMRWDPAGLNWHEYQIA